MKARILSTLAAVAAFLTVLGGLDLTGVISFLPDSLSKVATTALPALAGFVHLLRTGGDVLDDGQVNGSFKCHPFAFVGASALTVFAAMSLVSCVVRTEPNGAQTRRYDREAVDPWLQFLRDLTGTPEASEPEPEALTPIPAK